MIITYKNRNVNLSNNLTTTIVYKCIFIEYFFFFLNFNCLIDQCIIPVYYYAYSILVITIITINVIISYTRLF